MARKNLGPEHCCTRPKTFGDVEQKNTKTHLPQQVVAIQKTIESTKTHTLKGRLAWAMRRLVNAGHKGCTAIDNPAPRWSGYVHKLRGLGFAIETIHESHSGTFPGNHARYVLQETVVLREVAA